MANSLICCGNTIVPIMLRLKIPFFAYTSTSLLSQSGSISQRVAVTVSESVSAHKCPSAGPSALRGPSNMEESHDSYERGNTSALMTGLLSLSVTKRALYTTMSLLLCISQLGLLLTDVILHFVIKDLSSPSQHHTEAILVFQVVSFYWSLMASVYSLQAGNRKMGFIALLSVFLNLAIFIARFCYELLMIQYRREQF